MTTGDLHWPNWIGVVAEDRRFYSDVLGLAELGRGEDWLQFDMGWPNLFELVQRSDQPQYDRVR